jgi:hypothetical protein
MEEDDIPIPFCYKLLLGGAGDDDFQNFFGHVSYDLQYFGPKVTNI